MSQAELTELKKLSAKRLRQGRLNQVDMNRYWDLRTKQESANDN